jgi:2-keto-4-pentenoate hydratase/2-oxohepta-3-ene-1,7-dioic acid hydratase in catechol pathway
LSTVSFQGSTNRLAVGKIICVGRNYLKHAKEMNAELPRAPVLFLKPPTAIVPTGGTVVIPDISDDLHHEVEMTVVIGEGGNHIAPQDAPRHVAGYGVGLDMTLRDIQAEAKNKGLPWTIAKGFDTSAPVSPFVPADRIPDPHRLGIRLLCNGQLRQLGWTKEFVFRLGGLLSYCSRFLTLETGDVFFTGTPDGVARVIPGDTLSAELTDEAGSVLTSLSVTVVRGSVS